MALGVLALSSMLTGARGHKPGEAGGTRAAGATRQARKPPDVGRRARPNVLFIAVDDLRPELGCYGVRGIQTPNIDRLAARGLVFNRAYCQQAVCSPSRTSLLTGRRPDTTKIYDLKTHFRTTIPDVITLPQHFKQNGYHTQAFGKVFHLNDAPSWSVKTDPVNDAQLFRDGPTPAPGRTSEWPKSDRRYASWGIADGPDNALPDGKIADRAIETLQQIRNKPAGDGRASPAGRPFFLALGFKKPHLPFVAPRKYFDLYPPEKVKLAPNPSAPEDVPLIALHDSGELRNFSDIPKADAPVPDAKARELVRGYYAATSYVDAQVGRVLEALDRLGLRENTVVVLWGDHGWHLGEHGLWNKHTNFEVAARAPLIISVPGQKKAGAKTDSLVEFVDIYPTLCQAAGLPLPDGLEGTSLVPILDDPKRKVKGAALSQYPRAGGQAPQAERIMGYSLRTERWRYTEWMKRDSKKRIAAELYDHRTDPQENVNVAGRPENKEIVAALSKQLRARTGA